MTKTDKIITYLNEHGVNIQPFIRSYLYTAPGTVVIYSLGMFGYGGHYDKWVQLQKILSEEGCPVEMHKIRDPECAWRRYLLHYDRLTWNNKAVEK